MSSRTALLAALVPLAVLGTAPLRAQEPAPDTLPRVSLDTLAVRVLRTPVPILRAPFAVSVATGDEVRRARPGLALDEALAGIPGVQVDNRYNYALGERISVRGFGARAQFGVRGVRVLVDGIPATLPDGQTTLNHVDVGWLERAEVVRGPASALWGNASGGVVQLTTVAPPPVPLGTEARVVAGGNGLLRAQGAVGGRAGGWSYRAAATRLRYDGFREHSRAENTLASAQLARLGERSELRFTLNAVRYDALNPGSLSDSLLRVDRSRAFGRNVAQRTGEEGRQAQAGLTWRRELGAGALELSGYGVAREIDNPIPNVVIDLERRGGGVRAAWSAARPLGAGALRWTVGTEAEAQRDDRLNFRNVGGERGALVLDQRERVTGTAAFAQAALPLAGRLEVLGALRYDRVRFAVVDRIPATDRNPDDSGARVLDAWSPTLGVSFAAAPAVSLYANVATAFETPTTTELANRPDRAGGFNPELEPQRTVSYEAGAKGRLGARGGWELAAYLARVRDALIPFEVEGVPGRQFFRNAGAARHRGVEAGLRVAPLRQVTARLAYTYTDARFTDYVVGGEALDGNRVPGVAPHTLDARLAWESAAGAFAEVEARRASSVPVDDANRFRSPGYTVADLRAGWEGARLGGVRATPFVGVTNLFDVRYNTSVVVNAFGRRFFEPGPGRTLYAGIGVATGGR
ncbi:MAG TPA: TonB-dependent receptor [Longimicrobiaceae bacterium]|nr:TonB-dependent receptor [Longimicrobiaceae bacterium]